MAVTADKPAPYAPTSAILDIVSRFRNRGLVFPVTADVLARAGIPESLVSRTLQALITLDLFNEAGNPTETMEGIRLAPETEYKKRLEDWLRSAYADVFKFVDPATDDDARIRDAFRGYKPQGQQERMVTLFQGLCAAAGLVNEKKTSTPRSSTTTAARSFIVNARGSTHKQNPKNTPTTIPAGLPPALAGLLQSLPPGEAGWTKDKRDKFLITFETVLDFCFPVLEESARTENGGQM
jgi:hypothetical protein